MKIGFTGTRKGMSGTQVRQLIKVLSWLSPGRLSVSPDAEFHHGGAVGADVAAARLAAQYDRIKPRIHPAGRDPLKRNREIVAVVDVLIAAPETDQEVLRSGTWATIRYARHAGKPVIMLARGKE